MTRPIVEEKFSECARTRAERWGRGLGWTLLFLVAPTWGFVNGHVL